ncbi:MAG TPA: hypothetical protein VMU16_06080 [Candidatus Binataceae bacterium]|nr:hypothetical protein [Candidatus Binataceae bacterium]
MRSTIATILGVLLAANGVLMLVAPAPWYALTPGVVATGPFNPHFVRDIGCAYFVAGASLVWLAMDPRAWRAAMTGAAFLSLHAMVHVWDAASGRETLGRLIGDLPGVFAPPALAIWLAWPRNSKE